MDYTITYRILNDEENDKDEVMTMNADFSRTLALLRQEKGISQRKAAKELGISQALLSHYENGIREGSYLGGAFYQLYRALHRASGGKEGYFGLDATAYRSGAVDAQMRADYIAYASSLAQLSEKDGAFASMEDEALASLYPGLMQRVTQVLHSTEEKTNSLLGRK